MVEVPSEVSAGVDIAALLCAQSTQRLWLDLLGFCQPASGAPDPAGLKPRQLRRLLAEPLRALQRQIRRDADRFSARRPALEADCALTLARLARRRGMLD